ncbi:extracellular solute-binding protein [Paenibacillus eucommiae]|uniref:Aldouronate transport system substrate-binding protein n=1 Tax=Paenibacillus eucommiae TaxID=1355755 RepID=A0ABS4IRX9_9BACL|nr:extracellular solute-binding protein [Paenibacillus eucommiae]MBP1990334.1 putative aldouronate transport system substrate-binding protein [Paenibacillus eucommiae]
MKKRNWLYMVAVLTLILTVIGCQKKEASTEVKPAGNAESNMTEPGQYPIVKKPEPPITIAISKGSIAGIIDMNTNDATKWLEKKTNLNFEFNIGPEDPTEYQQKVNLMLASNTDLPDVFLHGLGVDQISTYGQQGTFLALNDYIDKYGVNIKKLMIKYPDLLKGVTAPDGNIYAIPGLNECQHCMNSQKFWINQKWLDKLGKKLPETPDELYEVLKAFKENDMNENGKQDELPLISMSDGWMNDLTGFLMNPFVISTGKGYDWLYLDQGEVKASYAQEGWRDGLGYLKKLYMDGLLDKEAFVLKSNQAPALTGGPDGNRVGAFAAGALSNGVDIANPGAREEFAALPPLKDSKGERKTPYIKPGAFPALVISKSAKNPEAAFRMGDSFLTDFTEDEEWREFFVGPEGKGWKKAGSGDIGLDGKPAVWIELTSHGSLGNESWGVASRLYEPARNKANLAVQPGIFNQESILYSASVNNYMPYQVDVVVPSVYYTEEEAQSMSEIKNQINRYVEENIFKFVTGEKDIEKNWDAYLKDLNKFGLENYIKTVQTAYDRQYKD